jgi:cytochrome c oxidase subunit 2
VNGLRAHGPAADHIARLFWLMLTLGTVIYILTMTVLVIALFRRRAEGRDTGFIIGGGVVLPTVVLLVLAVATVRTTNRVTAATPGALQIDVVGYQYWWEVAYPSGVTTANEIHIPVGRSVDVGLTSVDVIHSFWVPELAGKIDLVPGQRNVLHLRADRAGTYRGQCAEFCGLQHTHMAFLVIAQPPAEFDAWVEDQARPAVSASGLRGQDVFARVSCAGCHTVRGTDAGGTLGPDLTHFASRRTLGALTAANTPENLRQWVADAQSMKKGALMPPVPMSPDDVAAVVEYLETLR